MGASTGSDKITLSCGNPPCIHSLARVISFQLTDISKDRSGESLAASTVSGWSIGRVVRGVVLPGTALGSRALHAGFWGIAIVGALRMFSVVRVIVIARLLSPAAFGIFGVAIIVTSFQETVLKRLMFSPLIQHKGDIEGYLDTVWTVRLIANAIPVAILVTLSPVVANLLNSPSATPVVQVMLLTVFIRSFSNIGIVYFEKNLEFQKRFAYEIGFFAVEAIVGVILLVVMRDVWALVYGALAGSIAQVVISYALQPRRPTLQLDWSKASELFRFDRWVLSSLSLVYFVSHVDQVVVGRLVGIAPLGLFRMASELSRNVTVELAAVISKAAFPAFSQIDSDRARLRRGFLQAHQWSVLVMLPIVAGASILAKDFTFVLLGAQWVSMVSVFQLLMFAGLLNSSSQVASSLFMGVGQPGITTKLLVARLIVLGILIVPLTSRWGASGAASGVLISQLVVYPISVRKTLSLIDADVVSYLRTFVPPVMAAAVMVVAVFGFRNAEIVESSAVLLALGIPIGAIVYTTVMFGVDQVLGGNIRKAIRQRVVSQFGNA